MTPGHDARAKRWTAKRRTALVLEILRGETSVVEAARTHGLTVADVEDWRERFLAGAENALRSRPADADGQKDREIKRLKQKVGELVLDLDIGHPVGEGGYQGPPFAAAAVRRVMEALPTTSTRTICRVLGVARSARYRHQPTPPPHPRVAEAAARVARSKEFIDAHPTYGDRRMWARLRFGDGRVINHKKVRRLMRQQGWMVCQRPATPKPRVQRKQRIAQRRTARWALDATHIDGGADGWGHVVAVIDGYDREIGGWAWARRGRANAAERAREMACLARCGTLRPRGEVPIMRRDTGVICQSRRFRDACRCYRLPQACITPYTPEQHGLIERWFRSGTHWVKEACVWHYQFRTFAEAKQASTAWIRW